MILPHLRISLFKLGFSLEIKKSGINLQV